MGYKFWALIQGGEGPDVWDKEIQISAADFRDAASLAASKAEELGGQVVELRQDDYPIPSDTKRLDWLQGNLDRVKVECDLAQNHPFWFSQFKAQSMKDEKYASGADFRQAIDDAMLRNLT